MAQWDKAQPRELLGLFICVCIALCTIVAHNTAQNRPENFLSYLQTITIAQTVYLREREAGNHFANAAILSGRSLCGSMETITVYTPELSLMPRSSCDQRRGWPDSALKPRPRARADRATPTNFRDDSPGHVTPKRPEVICPLTRRRRRCAPFER